MIEDSQWKIPNIYHHLSSNQLHKDKILKDKNSPLARNLALITDQTRISFGQYFIRASNTISWNGHLPILRCFFPRCRWFWFIDTLLDQLCPTTSWQPLPETRLSRGGKKESRWDVAFVVPFSTSGGHDRLATSFFQAKDDTPEKESGLTGCLRGHGVRNENKSLEKSTDARP